MIINECRRDSNESVDKVKRYSQPRLTELETRYHLVRVTGKKKCVYTGKTVSVYELIDKGWEQLRLEAVV